MQTLTFWLVCAVLGFVIASAYNANQDALAVCQLAHSHDVCFQVLNR